MDATGYLIFPHVEKDKDYIHWLGKGVHSGANGDQEWTFRMYNHEDPVDYQERPNRISFYVFNPEGGQGVGSFVQTPIATGQWIISSVSWTARAPIFTRMAGIFHGHLPRTCAGLLRDPLPGSPQ